MGDRLERGVGGPQASAKGWREEPSAPCKLAFCLKKLRCCRQRRRSVYLPLASAFLSGKWDNEIIKL